MAFKDLLAKLDSTELGQKLKSLDKLYEKLKREQEHFCSSFSIHCINSCGSCCEVFTPDFTQAEAEYLALALIAQSKVEDFNKLLEKRDKNSATCPFYIKENAYHCSVYDYRPLVCRLFGSCASKDKLGKPVYKYCKWNKDENEIKTEDLEKKPNDIIYMDDYGRALEVINISDNKSDEFENAIQKALFKVNFVLDLLNQQSK